MIISHTLKHFEAYQAYNRVTDEVKQHQDLDALIAASINWNMKDIQWYHVKYENVPVDSEGFILATPANMLTSTILLDREVKNIELARSAIKKYQELCSDQYITPEPGDNLSYVTLQVTVETASDYVSKGIKAPKLFLYEAFLNRNHRVKSTQVLSIIKPKPQNEKAGV